MSPADDLSRFSGFGLSAPVLKALDDVGYESPSPIQQQCIPHLLDGRDIIGQAQTGTGKTAAFALPLLSNLDVRQRDPQVLVLTPTRELAIQVAEAIQSYARYIKGFRVLPVYGGQGYEVQLRPLKRGVHVVVGTPGRVMDHIKRGTLKLGGLKTLVLDEADEMLRMGFIDDVKWVLQQLPEQRQIALFSATMPTVIQRVAEQFLERPEVVKIKSKTTTATTIRQRYWQVSGVHKLDALTRILEVEPFEALLIFVRTKTATVELADKLQARGFAVEAINGDIQQKMRERTIDQLRKGKIDILVATDVAARGLDVERISHVINYDIPYDPEAYVHRIGRTGRAGRSGEAILFVAPREKRMLRTIERITRHPIEPMQLPTADAINQQRILAFKQKITDTLADCDTAVFETLILDFQQETGAETLAIAAALAHIAQGETPLLLLDKPVPARDSARRQGKHRDKHATEDKSSRQRPQKPRTSRDSRPDKPLQTQADRLKNFPEVDMRRYRLAVGRQHDVLPANIVGAIANEAGLDSCYIGSIEIHDDFSTVDLPDGMPKETLRDLKKVWVCGRKLDILALDDGGKPVPHGKRHKDNKTGAGKAAKKRGKKPAGKQPVSKRPAADRKAGKTGKPGDGNNPPRKKRKS